MKSNFMRCALFCLVAFPFVAAAEGEAPVVPPVAPLVVEVAPVVAPTVTKAAETVVKNSCSICSAAKAVARFCKDHPFVIGTAVVTLVVAGYVAYDLYKTAQEESAEETEELEVA